MSFKKILTFGCSYTEGGGVMEYKYLRERFNEGYAPVREKFATEKSIEYKGLDLEYARLYSYPGWLGTLLNIPVENYGLSCNNNENIIRTARRKTYTQSGNNILVVIQCTLLQRRAIFDRERQELLTFNGIESYPRKIGECREEMLNYYKDYLILEHDENYELAKLFEDLNGLIYELESRGYTTVILNAIEETPRIWSFYPYDERHLHLYVDGYPTSLQHWMRVNRYRIQDRPGTSVTPDNHATEETNKIIAEKIIDNLTHRGFL